MIFLHQQIKIALSRRKVLGNARAKIIPCNLRSCFYAVLLFIWIFLCLSVTKKHERHVRMGNEYIGLAAGM